nr:hypothetical protein [Tanacetum cinerariifolium]
MNSSFKLYNSSSFSKIKILKDSIDQKNRAVLADIFVDSIPEMFTDEHTLDYSSPPIFDVYADDFLEVESDAKNIYNDPFDSKGEKIKESKLLIDELDLPCDFHPPSEYDSFFSQDFFRVDALPSTNNEDKVKEKQEKDKIRTKSDENGKRGRAQQCIVSVLVHLGQGCQDRYPTHDHFCLCKIGIVRSDRDRKIPPKFLVLLIDVDES